MNTSVGRFECKSLGCDQYAGIPCLHKYPINKGHELFLLYTFAIIRSTMYLSIEGPTLVKC